MTSKNEHIPDHIKSIVSSIQRQICIEDDKRTNTALYKSDNLDTLVKNIDGIKCPNCKSENINCETKQIRSGDEGATNFYICIDCQYKWRRNN